MIYHLDYKKVKKVEVKPGVLAKEKLIHLAQKIHEYRSDKYWLMMITPNGEILIPEEDYKSHGDMIQDIIYPADPILCMIFDHFHGKGSSRKKGYFSEKTIISLCYGYINVDGEILTKPDGTDDYDYEGYEKICKCNPYALTMKTHCAVEQLKEYCLMSRTNDTNFADTEQIELSKKIVWLRNRINDDIEKCSKKFNMDILLRNPEMALDLFFIFMETTEEDYMKKLDDEYEIQRQENQKTFE